MSIASSSTISCPTQCLCYSLTEYYCAFIDSAVFIEMPDSLTTLHIRDSQIKVFSDEMAFLPDLRTLIILNTTLEELYLGKSFQKLRYVKVKGCMLSDFDGISIDAPNVKVLDLRDNRLKSPYRVVRLHSLVELRLENNNLTVFDSTMFEIDATRLLGLSDNIMLWHINLTLNAENVTNLWASKCSIKEFNATKFNLPKIESINLSRNPLETFHFTGNLENLTSLTIDQTNVDVLFVDTIKSIRLQFLSANEAPMTKLNICSGFGNLRQLRLRKTSIITWNLTNCDTKNLTDLEFQGSLLEKIDLSSGMENLKTLDLTSTRLVTFDSKCANVPKLSWLKIGPIRHFYMKSNLINLWHLQISGINAFDSTMMFLPALDSFTIRDSRIEGAFPILDFSSLQILQLIDVNMSILDSSRWKLPRLKSLFLTDLFCPILHLGEGTKSLMDLQMHGAYIGDLNATKYDLPNLQNLDIGECHFGNFELGNKLKKLQSLHIDKTKLEKLDEVYLPDEKTVNLSRTQLHKIDFTSGFEKLEYLTLSHTNITCFDASSLPSLTVLSLVDSPIEIVNLTGLSRLRTLEMRRLMMERFSTRGFHLPHLDDLYLEGKSFKQLYIDIKYVAHLELSNIEFEAFNSTVVNIPSLISIQLIDTNIKEVNLDDYKDLQILNVKGNNHPLKITFTTHQSLTVLDTGEGTILCDCQLIKGIEDWSFLQRFNKRLCHDNKRGTTLGEAWVNHECDQNFDISGKGLSNNHS